MDNYIELAKKIKELADRGVGGEKTNAKLLLKKLMKKHGITMKDIKGEECDLRKFIITSRKYKLFCQIVSTVIGRGKIMGTRLNKSHYFIDTTVHTQLEILSKFNFYWAMYKEELKIFDHAFIHANRLYPKDSKGDDTELSKEEEERIRRMQKMAQGIEKKEWLKQLETSKAS